MREVTLSVPEMSEERIYMLVSFPLVSLRISSEEMAIALEPAALLDCVWSRQMYLMSANLFEVSKIARVPWESPTMRPFPSLVTVAMQVSLRQ